MDAKTLIHDYLESNKGRWPEISAATGVNYWWIHKFMGRGIKHPGFEQVNALLTHIKREQRQRRRKAS